MLNAFNAQRVSIQQTGMQTLGLWALSNITIGTIAAFSTKSEEQAFWQMNAGWNIVNIGIAGIGYFSQSMPTTFQATLHEQQSIETLLAFNAGLDIAYIIGGCYLREKAHTSEQSERLRGFGNAIIIQGAFLLLFDAILYGVHAHHGSELPMIMNAINLRHNGIGLNINF